MHQPAIQLLIFQRLPEQVAYLENSDYPPNPQLSSSHELRRAHRLGQFEIS
jgi:hypothetical protein